VYTSVVEVPWQKALIDEARRNHGLITRATLASCRLTKDHLHRAKRKGIIEPVLPGIYRIAGAPPNRAGNRAAVSLWGGSSAVASA
jgi:hypothetical protein